MIGSVTKSAILGSCHLSLSKTFLFIIELTPSQSRCFLPNNDQTAPVRLPTYPFKMAAIMADKEDEVTMDDWLIILKESLSLHRRAAVFGKLSMLEVFFTTGNAFSMLDRSLKPVKGFSLVDSDCHLLRLGVQ